MVTLTAQADSARRSCSGRPLTASVAVSPEIAPAVKTVALLFNRQRHLVAGHCVEVQVAAAPPAAVAAQVDGQGPAKGLPAVDAWIPDSSLWVDVARGFPMGARVVQPTGITVARSPLMIVMPPAGRGPGRCLRQPRSAGTSCCRPPTAARRRSQRLQVDLPDPNQSAAGLATLVQIGRTLGSGAAARTAFAKFVFSVEVTSQFQGPLGLTPFVTLANPPLNGNPVTVTSEQAVLAVRPRPPRPAAGRPVPVEPDARPGQPATRLSLSWSPLPSRPS